MGHFDEKERKTLVNLMRKVSPALRKIRLEEELG
jgi:hypothetical protein